MGGKTVMQYAMQYPEAFESLVVVDIAPKAYPVHHTAILNGLKAIPLTEIQNRNDAEAILRQYEPSPTVRQFLLKNLYRNDAGVFDWRINLSVLASNIELIGDDISQQRVVEQPTLFIRGINSNYVLDEDIATIQGLFPNVVIDTIADAGHWVQAEQPGAFVASLMAFLKD
jgi:pimeloyl-ACP methyl ester carboxylesterase